ncbi:hypothetical protein ACFLTP_05370 [Chloroflexota bacterium]
MKTLIIKILTFVLVLCFTLLLVTPVMAINLPPEPDAGSDQLVEGNTIGGAENICLDGTGSSDPEGDPIAYKWVGTGVIFDNDESPTPNVFCPIGITTITLTVTDSHGNADTDDVDIEVVDTTPPVIVCNAPGTIAPPDAPISFTATATDTVDSSPLVEITEFACYKYTKKGKRIDKSESCIIDMTGDTITILDTGGIGTTIEWTVEATDDSGNESEHVCHVYVVNPNSP